MPALDREILAERVGTIERHLARVAQRLPERAEDLQPATDASDAVVLHRWQAVQVVRDLAIALCVQRNLGTPSSYGDAFERLAAAGDLDRPLATRLAKAADPGTSSRSRTRGSPWRAFARRPPTVRRICAPS